MDISKKLFLFENRQKQRKHRYVTTLIVQQKLQAKKAQKIKA